MSKYPVFAVRPASQAEMEQLEDVLHGACGAGSTDASYICCCGREHVATIEGFKHHGDMVSWERLVATAKEDPEKVVFTNSDRVYAYPFVLPNGQDGMYVSGCPCNALLFMAQWTRLNMPFVAALARHFSVQAKRRADKLAATPVLLPKPSKSWVSDRFKAWLRNAGSSLFIIQTFRYNVLVRQ